MAQPTIKKMIEIEDQEGKTADQLWDDFKIIATAHGGHLKKAVPMALRLYILVRTLEDKFSFETHTIKVVKRGNS